MQDNNAEEAVLDLEEILKKYPSGKDPLFLMAQVRISLGQIDQGRAFISDLEKYHPSYLKTGLLKIQAAFSAGEPETALKQANELITKVDTAVPNAGTDAQGIQDLRVRALSSRGLAYLDLGKVPEAKTDLGQIVKLSPRSSSAMVNLAKVYSAERNHQGAIDLYEKALVADAQNFDAMSGIVNASLQLHQTAKAHTRADELINSSQGKPDILAALHYLKSTIFIVEKNMAAAEQELLTSIGQDQNYLPSYSAYANLLVSQNRTDEAIVQYKRVVEKKPAAQIYTMLGILEDARGNTAEAEKNYRQALQIAPDAAIAANNLAWLIAENQGNLDEALQLATGAVNKNQTVAGYYDTLGWVYLKKGLYAPAVQQLRKAVALDESNTQKTGTAPTPGYRVRLGIALEKAGDRSSARSQAEKLLQDPTSLSPREASDVRGLLASS
jgi:tetratricopeptide (TPR) repeat protein